MKYGIKITYSSVLVFENYEDFIAEIGLLIEGGLKSFEILTIEEEEKEEE